ncbi:nitrogen regulation protein NR(II) [Desulfuromonas sp. TF]|uniref:two-component system sensor histidine kinase NtrB n=1 Tax=Desulfuromonas sp. TF TaxID=1232410 RepID=UPI0004273192|nr:ATP-binding protein [Desulfuromonas sp. TF]
MDKIKHARVDEAHLDQLLGLSSSKIGFYADVKQKIQELEAANIGLRAKKSELQAVFDAISDGLIVFDHRAVIQHRNHVCARLFPAQTLVGKGCRHIFHKDRSRAPESCPVERALAGESCQVSITFSRDEEGKSLPRHFDISATTIEDPSGSNRALLFLRDVTEKRTQELQLMQAEKMSSLGVLAAGVAHEINNPLNSVAGYAEALLRRFRDAPDLAVDPRLEDFQGYLNVIIREAYRCKGVIDGLLSFSRKSDGTISAVDVNELMKEVLELLRHKSRYDKVSIDFDGCADPPVVKGDAAALRQVFLNLVLNAVQAIDGPGLVAISTAVKGDEVVVRVRDTGSGIAPETLDQIWNPFFTTKSVGQGLGLGLAVSYNIVKKHSGEVQVETEIGKGTLFSVRLPACREK